MKLLKPGFEKIGFLDILSLLNDVSKEVEKAVSAYKWQGQRILRPEEFANLVQLTKTSGMNKYHVSTDLFKPQGDIDLLAWVNRNNKLAGADTYLMPLAYPEGAPLHPSYPSGHATFSGAYITVLKAIFNDQAPFSCVYDPVKPDFEDPAKLQKISKDVARHMTIGGELNKLASNIAVGRNFAGIHYRADADYGMRLGEIVALSFLKKYAVKKKDFKGFELTKLDGTRIRSGAKKAHENDKRK